MEPKSKRNSAVVRISQLPDDILVHVLSYIPTFDSVRTMVLSKRWKNLWTFVPALDFDQQEYSKRHGDDRAWYTIDEFNKFVDGALSLHNPSTIRKFRLHFVRNVQLRDEDFPRIRHWIRTAMRHEICELDLSFVPCRWHKIELELPPRVVLCKTLEVLKVESNCIAYPRTSPGCFPSLKLADITTEDVNNSSLTELFCNCPALEELRIQASFYQNDVEFSISAPELHTLRTRLLLNVDEEIREVKGISIDAPKLKFFFVSGKLTRFIFLNAKPLVKANIEEDFVYQDLNPELLKRANALFAGVSSVEHLHLCGRNYMACSLPVFSNLRQLKLKLFHCLYLEYLMELLKRSPTLEDLVLDIDVRSWYDQEYVEGYEPFKPPEIVPICIVSQLKTVSITHITGHDELLDLVEYILKYGRVLKEIFLSTSGELLFQSRHMTEEKFKRQILKYQKSSNTCEVELKFEMEGIGSTSCSDCGSILLYSERII